MDDKGEIREKLKEFKVSRWAQAQSEFVYKERLNQEVSSVVSVEVQTDYKKQPTAQSLKLKSHSKLNPILPGSF